MSFRGRGGSRGGGGGAGQQRRGGGNSGGGGLRGGRGGGRGGGAGRGGSRGRGGKGGQKRDRREYEEGEEEEGHNYGQHHEDDEDGDNGGHAASTSTSSEFSLSRALAASASDSDEDGPSEYDRLLSALRGPTKSTSSSGSRAAAEVSSLAKQHKEILRRRAREERGKEDGEYDSQDEEDAEDDEEGEPQYEEVEVEEGAEDDEDEDDEEMEDGEEDDGEDSEDDDDEENGTRSKRRKMVDGDDEDGEDDEEGEDEDDEAEEDVSGDDALSDDEDGEAGEVGDASAAVDLSSPDLFQRKFSHFHTLTPSQLSILDSSPNDYSRKYPWTKVPSSVLCSNGRPTEMVFLAGDPTTRTKNSDGTIPSSYESIDMIAPQAGIATPSLNMLPKVQETWLRSIVEPERRRMLKKAKKAGVKAGIKDEDDEEDEYARPAADEESTLIAKSDPLTPPSKRFCSVGGGTECTCFLCSDFYSPFQARMFTHLTSYRDIVLTHCTPLIARTVHDSIAAHIVNHLLKGREKVLRNSQDIAKAEEKERQRKDAERMSKKAWRDHLAVAKKLKQPLPPQPESGKPLDIPERRDQGFTRPKVLCLFPTAKVAGEFVDKMMKLLPPKSKTIEQKRKRFETDFSTTPEDRCHPERPYEYKYYFDGKDSDAFRCGISFGQKMVKYYTPFYSADVIIASPLGLRMITGSVGDKLSEREYDFLSSIELLLIDSFDIVTTMQNSQHLSTIMEVLNLTPYDTKHSDFGRIREWNLAKHSKFYRQTILLSSHPSLELQNFQKLWCSNSEGKLQSRVSYKGLLTRVIPSVKQIFQKILCDKFIQLPDVRFEYFTQIVLPQLKSSYPDGHILIYIPSYFDYVRVRNYVKSKHLSVTYASEYTKNSALSRGRSGFFHGELKFMLLTERFHFFKRYAIRGVRHIVFYGLPTYEQFYVDFVNLLPSSNTSGGSTGTVMALYSKFDSLELERIIGTQRATKLIQAQNNTHMFC